MRLAVVLLLLLPLAGASVQDPADAWMESNGPLRVGVTRNIAPSAFVLPDGSVGGWGVDLMQLASLKTGIDVEFVVVDTIPDGVAMLRNGSIDAVGIMGARPDLDFARMGTPWSWTPVTLLTNNDHDWATPDDAVGRISTIHGSPLQGIVDERFGHMDYVQTANPAAGMEALANGTIDAYLGPLAVAGYQIQRLQLEGLRPVGEHLSIVETGFWAADDGALAVVNALRASITADEAKLIYVKWTGFDLSEPVEPEGGVPAWVQYALLAALGAIVLATAFIQLLRSRVRHATAEVAALNRDLEARVAEQTQEIRRQSQRLEALFQASPVGVALTTPEGQIEVVNPALCTMLGYTETEMLAMRAPDIWADPNDRTKVLETLRSGKSIRSLLTSLKTKGGGQRRAEMSFDLVDVGGNTRLLGTAFDVTEREAAREIQEQHVRTLMELESAQKMERFAMDLINRTAHELGTPLTPLVLGMQTLRASLGDEHAEAMDRLDRSVQRLRETVTTAVEASRVQAAVLRSGRQNVDVAEALAAQAKLHEPTANHAKVTLQVEAEAAQVEVDAARLQLALGHLVGNALKFTPEGGSVTLRCRHVEGHVRIEVEDTGPGIDPELLERLWQPYAQAGEVSIAGREGQGLGLYVTKRLMDLEGATVGCESRHGEGSTFWLEFAAA